MSKAGLVPLSKSRTSRGGPRPSEALVNLLGVNSGCFLKTEKMMRGWFHSFRGEVPGGGDSEQSKGYLERFG